MWPVLAWPPCRPPATNAPAAGRGWRKSASRQSIRCSAFAVKRPCHDDHRGERATPVALVRCYNAKEGAPLEWRAPTKEQDMMRRLDRQAMLLVLVTLLADQISKQLLLGYLLKADSTV